MNIIYDNDENQPNSANNRQYQYQSNPQPEAHTYEKAPIFERIIAKLIDDALQLVVLLPMIIWLVGIVSELAVTDEVNPVTAILGTTWMIILSIALLIAAFLYSILRDGMRGGQSIGKRIMGLKTITLPDARNCDYTGSVIRNLVLFLLSSLLGVGSIIELVLIIAREDGRRLGDLAANTMVVKA